MQSTGARKVIPISREFESDDRYTTRLSVGHGTGEWIGGARAVVTYQGGDDCSGAWSCSKDGRGACAHIRAGRKWLLRALNPGKGGEDGDDDEFFQGMDARKIHAACGRHDADVHEVSAVRKAAKDDGAISYLDVLPPHWAELPSDKEGSTYYPRPPPVRKPGDVPDLLRLEAHSSCNCAGGRSYFNAANPIIEQQCTIFGLLGRWECMVQVQKCPKCPGRRRRYIGPDCRQLGLFNYNNTVFVSHELLNEYTSDYTLGEKPFVGWVEGLGRRYALNGHTFLPVKQFISVWFAYAFLYSLGKDMACPTCGPSPKHVIWDGVTVAFSKKHLSGTLRPPTVTSAESPSRDKCVYRPHQQWIVDPKLRKAMKKALEPPKRVTLSDAAMNAASVAEREAHQLAAASKTSQDHVEGSEAPVVEGVEQGEEEDEEEEGPPVAPQVVEEVSEDEEEGERATEGTKAKAEAQREKAEITAALEHIERLGEIQMGLCSVSLGLLALFMENYGFSSWWARKKPIPAYRKLLIQVRDFTKADFTALTESGASCVRRSRRYR